MSGPVEFSSNSATATQVASHLSRCDVDFEPLLSARVDIAEYSEKIVDNAMRFEAWAGGALVGLVAAYCNDSERRTAYITNVSVCREWQGGGVASRLLVRCIEYVNEQRFKRIELEVDRENFGAIKLYEKYDFTVNSVNGSAVVMHLNVDRKSE